MPSVLIIAGESSGDSHGADLVHEFRKKHPHTDFFGIGGSRMEEEGVRLLFSSRDLAVVGLFEVIRHLPKIRAIYKSLINFVRREKPAAAVLIDSPDFNLRLAKKLKKMSIPILYYISPTVWVWRKGRLKTIKRSVDRMMLIFPFEEDLYRAYGISAVYIGHPLSRKMDVALNRADFFFKHGLDPGKTTICVLPGSRESEIRFHMPVLIRSMESIDPDRQKQFVFVKAKNLSSHFLRQYIPSHMSHVVLLENDGYPAMRHCDLALSSCGTANLELALLETPFIAFYRLSRLTYHLGIHLLKLKMYSIVNILAGKRVIPELIQKDFTSDNLANQVRMLLDSTESREQMIGEFKNIKELLGNEDASQNAAGELESLLRSKTL